MYILSANPRKSRIFEKYYQYETVYWKTDILVETGEEIYIYCSGNYKKIMIKCEVIKTNISFKEVIKNLEGDTSDIVPDKKYILLKYLKLIDSEKLSSIKLKEQGFRPPQHACKLTENKNKDLIHIIKNEFEICEELKEDIFQEKELKKTAQNKLIKNHTYFMKK